MSVSISSTIFYQQDGSSVLWTPTHQPDMSATYGTDYSGISANQAYGGEMYTIERFGKRRFWNLSWTFLNESERNYAEAVIDYADGRLNWFTWTPDGGSTKYSVFMTQDTFDLTEVAYRAFSLSLSFIEKL